MKQSTTSIILGVGVIFVSHFRSIWYNIGKIII